VLDPGTGRDEIADVLVVDGRIASIGGTASVDAAVVDAQGKLVVPGLIDGHVHCYGGIGPFSADALGVRSGATTVIDAGSAGTATIDDAIAATEGSATDVCNILFLHPQGIGAPITNRRITSSSGGRALAQLADVPVGEIVRTAERLGDRIRAVKSSAFPERGPEWIGFVRQIARWTGLPPYFHIGNFGHDSPWQDGMGGHFAELREGDIVTHVFTGATGGVLDDEGAVYGSVLEAQARGVHFDLGFGPTGFDFDVAERAIDQGLHLGSISTDFQKASTRDGRYDLVDLMGIVACLGYSIEEIVRMVTTVPADMFGLSTDGRGRLEVGGPADLTVLEVESGAFEYRDMNRKTRTGPLRFDVALTVKAGQPHEPRPDDVNAPAQRRHDIIDDLDDLASRLPDGSADLLDSLARAFAVAPRWDAAGLHGVAHELIQHSGLGLRAGLAAVYGSFMCRDDGPQLGWWLVSLQEEEGVDVAARLAAVAQRL